MRQQFEKFDEFGEVKMLVELTLKNTGGQVVINAGQITTLTSIELGCRVSIGPFYSIDVVEQPERVRGMWQAALRSERVARFAVALVGTEWCYNPEARDFTADKVWEWAEKLADAEPPTILDN